MSWTYDWTNYPDLARLRFMVGDTDPTTPIYQDAELNAALSANNSQNIIIGLSGYTPATPPTSCYSFGRAAAMALNALGAVRARTLIKKVLDVEVDGSAAMKALRDLGQSYIDQEVSAGYFAVAEMVQDPFSMRERLWKMLYRIVA